MILLAKERYYGSWTGMQQTACGGSSTAMVDHCRDVLKKPLVRAVAKPENVGGRGLIGAEFAPTPGDDGSTAYLLNRFNKSICKLDWIIDHDTAEANVNRWWATSEERFEFRVWLVVGRFTKEEATNIWEVSVSKISVETRKGKRGVTHRYSLANPLALVPAKATSSM